MKNSIMIAVAVASIAGGCMPDSELARRVESTERLRSEARALGRKVARVDSYRSELELALKSGSRTQSAVSLIRELRSCGFVVEKGRDGVIRLGLSASLIDVGEDIDSKTRSRLIRGAALLREYLPNHELSIESNDFSRAVAAVRVLNEKAGVPGIRLRAIRGRAGALMVNVRPTRIEALQEVLAATPE